MREVIITDKQVEAITDYIEANFLGSVNTVWYLTEYDCDGQLLIVADTTIERGSVEQLFFDGRISTILDGSAVLFDYKADVLENKTSFIANIFNSGKRKIIYQAK